MTTTPIAVVAALREEVAPLVARLDEGTDEHADGPYPRVYGRLAGTPLVIAWTGEGEVNARRGSEWLLAAVPGAPLVVIGIAGALSPQLGVGELVVGERVHCAERSLSPDAGWRETALLQGVTGGAILTVDEIVCSPSRKADLWRRLGEPATAVVDMESFHHAAAAQRLNRPCLILRAVSDLAAERLPPFLEGCRDRDGGIDRSLVVRQALLRPRSLPTLLRLNRRLRRGAERLAVAVAGLLAGASDRAAAAGSVPCAG